METGASIASVASRLVAANVYLGARPIADALQGGGRFVITGHVADASLTLGPAAAHFGWGWDEWAKLAGALVAGHLIECGAQATGGLWHGWNRLPDFAGVGYPIVELVADGSCVITKPRGTGGQVSIATVTEQLLYEIDDPAHYRTPDVDVDFTEVSLEQVGADRVAVKQAVGQPPSDQLKLVAVYKDGWTASGMLAVVGRDAEAKARAAGAMILERVARAGYHLAVALVECFGSGDVAPGVIRPASPPFEVVLRVTVRTPTARPLNGSVASWPHWSPRDHLGSSAMPRGAVPRARVWLLASAGTTHAGRGTPQDRRPDGRGVGQSVVKSREVSKIPLMSRGLGLTMSEASRWIRLGELAHTRSGDKGNRSNIGVVANDRASYDWLKTCLTESVVADFLRPMGIGPVRRYGIACAPRFQLCD